MLYQRTIKVKRAALAERKYRIRLKITLADRKARFLLLGKARCPRLYFMYCCVATELVRSKVLIAMLTPLSPLPVN